MRYVAQSRLILRQWHVMLGLGVVGMLMFACAPPPAPDPPVTSALLALTVTIHADTLTFAVRHPSR